MTKQKNWIHDQKLQFFSDRHDFIMCFLQNGKIFSGIINRYDEYSIEMISKVKHNDTQGVNEIVYYIKRDNIVAISKAKNFKDDDEHLLNRGKKHD